MVVLVVGEGDVVLVLVVEEGGVVVVAVAVEGEDGGEVVEEVRHRKRFMHRRQSMSVGTTGI
jgi:hypothetical protein